MRTLFAFLKRSPDNETLYRAMLDAFAFADHLLAYHDQEQMNKIREFLVAQVTKADTSLTVKQYIWRLLVLGWYKLASNVET